MEGHSTSYSNTQMLRPSRLLYGVDTVQSPPSINEHALSTERDTVDTSTLAYLA